MYTAYQKVLEHFDEQGFKYQTQADEQVVFAVMGGTNGVFPLLAAVPPDDNLLMLMGVLPFSVPQGCLSAIAETITRINHSLKVGRFEMDYDDGKLRFQASSVIDEELSDNTIRRLIMTVLAMCDRFAPCFNSVIYSNEAPADAVKRIQLQPAV